MQTMPPSTHDSSRSQTTAAVLRGVGWLSLWLQLILAIATGITVAIAVSGRQLTQYIWRTPTGAADPGPVTSGLGIGIFFAVCGIIVILFNVFICLRATQFAKRIRHPNPERHPKKTEVLELLRLGSMSAMVGLLLTILGEGASLGVLLSKSVSLIPGAAFYDPTRIIRATDVFVAVANLNGITGNFVGALSSLWLLNWTSRR